MNAVFCRNYNNTKRGKKQDCFLPASGIIMRVVDKKTLFCKHATAQTAFPTVKNTVLTVVKLLFLYYNYKE